VTRRTVEFGCAIVIIGLLAGVAGATTTLLLHAVEHLTYHFTFGTLLTGVGDSSPVPARRRPDDRGRTGGMWLVDSSTARRGPELTETIKSHRPIPRLAMSIDAGLQVLLIGSGASLAARALRANSPRH